MPRKISPEMSLDTAIRNAVEAAIRKGWSVNAIAVASGVSQPVLHRWLAGTREVKLQTGSRLAAWCGMRLTTPQLPPPPTAVVRKPRKGRDGSAAQS